VQLRPKKKSIQKRIAVFSFLGLSLVFFQSNRALALSGCEGFLQSEFRESKKLFEKNADFEVTGLTPLGLEAQKSARDTYRSRLKLFATQIRNLGTLHHVANVARLMKTHLFLMGPPGGAKSMFVNWMLSGEREKAFKFQMHQMATELPLVGGQNFEAATEGRFEGNTKGSLAMHTIGLIDEVEKGNPAALSPLLSLLNENQVLLGNQVIKGRLETLFSTSNANLAEIFKQFRENGMESTAAALLNRFPFKSFVYNWLSIEDQAILDKRREKMRRLKALAPQNPEVLKDEVFLTPEVMNWEEMRRLADAMFRPSKELEIRAREFANEMRKVTLDAVKQSEAEKAKDPYGKSEVYFPSFDPTERLRGLIIEVIIASAYLDYLKSPLADKDSDIEAVFKNPIELDEWSIWRAYLLMTTVGPGEVKLVYNAEAEQPLDIDFDWSVEPSEARDAREEQLILNVLAEQDRFRTLLQSQLEKKQKAMKDRSEGTASITSKRNKVKQAQESLSFELRLLQTREN